MINHETTKPQDNRIRRVDGFTLAELLVSVGVLVLVVLLATQLLNSAATITILGHKQMDADSQARQVLDRMAIDFAQMVKRSDVDYYLKSSATPPPTGVRNVPQIGNDQMAFYSTVPGYYPSTGSQSPVSLVAYRVNGQNKLERMGKGLVWNAVSTSDTPIVFIPIPISSPLPTPEVPVPTATPPTPAPAWPQAGNTTSDPDYEVTGPQVFRFEYYYLLKGGLNPTGGFLTSILSDIPWDTRILGHSAPEGMQDIAAVVVDIAVIDPKTKVLVSDCQLAQLNGAPLPSSCTPPAQYPVLIDWGNTTCNNCPTQTQWQTTPGLLLAQWRAAVDANAIGLPPPALSGIRLYERRFYLSPPTLNTP
jgi:hypothetical protein